MPRKRRGQRPGGGRPGQRPRRDLEQGPPAPEAETPAVEPEVQEAAAPEVTPEVTPEAKPEAAPENGGES